MNRSGGGRLTILVCFSILVSLPALSAPIDTELHHRILNTTVSSKPAIIRDTVMFSYSAPGGAQMVALAFEHEQYRRFHIYERNPHGVFVLTLPLPDAMSNLRYRLVVDGLWTVDTNSDVVADNRGILVSSLALPTSASAPKPGVKRMPSGSIRFVYRGDSDSRVSLIGDFNRWDPFLTPMAESPIHPGFYALTLNLPADSRLYRFVVDGREILDPENSVNARNGWGETASVIP